MTTLRKIDESDLEIIKDWRMRPDITKWMNTDPELTLEGQKQWLKKISNDASYRYWVIEVDSEPVGLINLADINIKTQECGWAYYIGERGKRSFALAISLECSLYDYVFGTMKMEKLKGNVLSINDAVIEIHRLCGSKVVGIEKDAVFKNGKYFDSVLMEITNSEWSEFKKTISYEKINFDV